MEAERKRPWYLVLALLGALGLGISVAQSGYAWAAIYHSTVDASGPAQSVTDAKDHALIIQRAEAFIAAVDAARPRGWPLAVAMIVLGTATLVFVARAFGGSAGARAALVQLVVAQAGLNLAEPYLLRDVYEAKLQLGEAIGVAKEHQGGLPRDGSPLVSVKVLRGANAVILALQTLGAALVVVGLTRRRSREYFDAASAAVQER